MISAGACRLAGVQRHQVQGLRVHVPDHQGERERRREAALLPHSDGRRRIEVS
jgi:hypothetical protein